MVCDKANKDAVRGRCINLVKDDDMSRLVTVNENLRIKMIEMWVKGIIPCIE